MIRTLAEPTLTAVSGETANFLAGGEFAFRSPAIDRTTASSRVDFKQFGVQLAFTPVVLSRRPHQHQGAQRGQRDSHGFVPTSGNPDPQHASRPRRRSSSPPAAPS